MKTKLISISSGKISLLNWCKLMMYDYLSYYNKVQLTFTQLKGHPLDHAFSDKGNPKPQARIIIQTHDSDCDPDISRLPMVSLTIHLVL